MKNIDMLTRCAYKDQQSFNPMTSNCRYELFPTYFSSLYRKHSRENGIEIEISLEYNLDNWLNPDHRDSERNCMKQYFTTAHKEQLRNA